MHTYMHLRINDQSRISPLLFPHLMEELLLREMTKDKTNRRKRERETKMIDLHVLIVSVFPPISYISLLFISLSQYIIIRNSMHKDNRRLYFIPILKLNAYIF